jgi:quercetin dioxygenase-like cupin family protein
VQYARLYADADGESHFEDVEVPLTPVNFAPPAAPLNLAPFIPAAQFSFLGAPAGWYGDWHPAPRRQFFCILAGECEFAASDGTARRFPSGSVLLLEDTKGKGHATRVLSEDALLVTVVQLPD